MRTLSLIALATVLLAGCGGDDTKKKAEPAKAPLPQGSEKVKLDPAEFTTEIDNPYWPMSKGSRWTYRETDQEGARKKVVVTVTGKTKKIANGVEAVVVHDVVTEDGVPIEVTDDWYAQDSEGNIWYLGEDTTEYENGKPTSKAGSFEAGVDGAQAGIIMPADPKPGLSYRQEYYKGEAEDRASIVGTNEQAEVPSGHYEGVLMTRDENPLDPKVLEFNSLRRASGRSWRSACPAARTARSCSATGRVGADPGRLSRTTPASRINPAPTISR